MRKNMNRTLLNAAVLSLLFLLLLSIIPINNSNAESYEPDDCGEFWSLSIRVTYTGACAECIEWDFGDGTPIVTEWDLTHTYETVGDYIITQTVYNSFGGGFFTTDQYLIHIMGQPYVELHQPVGTPRNSENKIYADIHSPAIRPEDPVWEGHDFEGWFLDEELTIPFDWTVNLKEPVNAYASYSINYPQDVDSIVIFKNRGAMVTSDPLIYDANVIAPENPLKTCSYDFVSSGWESYNKGVKVTNDATFNVNFTNVENSLALNFTADKDLPTNTSVSYYLGDKISDGTKLSLFFYDEDTKQIKNLSQTVTVVNGYATFEMMPGSSYVLSEIFQDVTDSDNIISYIGITMIVLTIGLLAVVVVHHRNKF